MNAYASKRTGDGLVEVVVARGRSIVDIDGKQVPAGQTARIPREELPSIIAAGFVCDPADPATEETTRQSAEAARIAANLGRLAGQHLSAIAFGLRPNQDGGLLRARQFLAAIEDLRKQGEQLVATLTPASER
ncbi:MAG: hypothetical protein ACTHJG_02075 [Rhodanobacteraceae bacterium]